jgi:hypothetical protein
LKKLLLPLFILLAVASKAQKVDSIYFHLYTDSLKKGVHNYINVDGKLSNGGWLPLTAKQLQFSCSSGRFEGNDLILAPDFAEEKVTVTAALISNPSIRKEITIWIKKKADDEVLPTKEEILNNKTPKKRSRRN